MELTGEEARVLGCLIEKELTTPDYYPLTLNSLLTACNQSSNRDPVVGYDESTVTRAIDGLREKQLVRWVKEARSRSSKYRHNLEAVPGLNVAERSLIAVLLLRGPQTAGELRGRTDRYYTFSGVDEVERILGALSRREHPVTERLERQPGQKEARWRELWNTDRSAEPIAPSWPDAGAGKVDTQVAPAQDPSLADLVADLKRRIERLERELGLDEA